MSPRVYCYDTEFLENGHTIDLISIGIVCDDGSEYYAVNADCNFNSIREDDWLWANVIPSLPTTKKNWDEPQRGRLITSLDLRASVVKPKWVIANEVRDFITECLPGDTPFLWADYAAYDHVALAQLWGKMIDLPTGIPMFTHELRQLLEQIPGTVTLPRQATGEHNALEDARHNLKVYRAARAYLLSQEGIPA